MWRLNWRRIAPVVGFVGFAPPIVAIGAQRSGSVDLGLSPVVFGAALWITFVMVITGAAVILINRRSSA